jgi:hypothetical protein
MPINTVKTDTTAVQYKEDRGGEEQIIPFPVIGIVKDNIDASRNGRIRVYVSAYGGINPEDSDSWISVDYMSPWFGLISPEYDASKNPSKNEYGEYIGNPHSYGMWASAPDVGSEVICIFINGRKQQGYYIGGIPKAGLHQMVPAMGGSPSFVPNEKEAQSYGSAKLLPVTEINYQTFGTNQQTFAVPKPIHSYQAATYFVQGLLRDNIRGIISSSSQRETPSKVFGISTPGTAIYSGGYTPKDLANSLKTADISKLQTIGRTGGHSIVLDDGDINGQNQLIRLRTSAGHQIMMNDSGQSLFIIHANGQSWVELGKEGTIDVFSTNSVNIRTNGDINLHADRDINMHAKRSLNMFSNSIKTEADTNITNRAGGEIKHHCIANYSVKAEGTMTFQSTAVANFSSNALTYIKGNTLFLNTGSGPTASSVSQLEKTTHTDTEFDSEVGWINPSKNPLFSIVSRAPTHQPYIGSNTGIDL